MHYIGKKGYTVLKSQLSSFECKRIESDLSIRPFVLEQYASAGGGGGGGGGGGEDSSTYPVYRQTIDKYFLPKFYGTKVFGNAMTIKLQPPTLIAEDILFRGELREEQQKVVSIYMQHCNPESAVNGGMLEIPCGGGKTLIGLYIFAQLRLKTIVIVHKEFLLEQWSERIREFLPGTRVGRIQGTVIDIENKDIVIGMLQSLSMKEYDIDIFASFGFMIVDEVHHISSQVFSRALFKIVTPYTLGLSATMNRKDGTTDVFKMFLGEIIYKGHRDIEHHVEVHAYRYRPPAGDVEFCHVITDFSGKMKYSSMISKLANYLPRNRYVASIVLKMLSENTNQQIMIIAQYRCVLDTLYELLKDSGYSLGYYVGGMKKENLKLSESHQMILATYSMAAEALDIKTLTTLIMATPKTDIEQAVGRILRDKHSNPIVVDIIDIHKPFEAQFRKRKQFYKSQKYEIINKE